MHQNQTRWAARSDNRCVSVKYTDWKVTSRTSRKRIPGAVATLAVHRQADWRDLQPVDQQLILAGCSLIDGPAALVDVLAAPALRPYVLLPPQVLPG